MIPADPMKHPDVVLLRRYLTLVYVRTFKAVPFNRGKARVNWLTVWLLKRATVKALRKFEGLDERRWRRKTRLPTHYNCRCVITGVTDL